VPAIGRLSVLGRSATEFHLSKGCPETWVRVLAFGVHLVQASVHEGRVRGRADPLHQHVMLTPKAVRPLPATSDLGELTPESPPRRARRIWWEHAAARAREPARSNASR
jgi:hypothetical protein